MTSHQNMVFNQNEIKTKFYNALDCEDYDTLIYLMTSSKMPVNINEYDNYYHTPLIRAASFGSLNIVKFLLESEDIPQKSDIYQENKSGFDAFLSAVKHDKLDIVKYLLTSPSLSNHSNINKVCNDGYNALTYALHSNANEIVDYLLFSTKLNQEINVHHRNNRGWCALRNAIIRDDDKVIKYLIIDKNVVFNKEDKQWLLQEANKSQDRIDFILDLINKRESYLKFNENISLNKTRSNIKKI